VAKMELYRWLQLPKPTDEALEKGDSFEPGYCHFPEYGEEFFKQLTAEKRVIRLQRGFPKASWVKEPNQNNEVLDCRVYARAAASIYGLDRFNELQWKRLETALNATARAKTAELTFTPTESTTPSKSSLFSGLEQHASTVADDPYLS